MEAAHLSVQTSVCDLKEQINHVENSLSLLLADTPQHIQRTSWAEVTFACPESLSIGLPIQLLANRPDVRAAERNLEAAFYSTNMARSAFYPSVSLSGSAGWTNSAGGVIINPGKFLASAVGSLTQPFFAQGRLVGQLKIAKAQQEQASLAFQQALFNAGAEVNEAMVACETSRAKSDLLDRQVASLEKAYHSTSLLMQHGTTTYLEVLTAQQSLLSAQLQQTANRFKEIQCIINLYLALGGSKN
jgi:outer membrane protein TolC